MKYLKKFENLQSNPKEGDYVLISSTLSIISLNDFLKDNIGKIIELKYHSDYVSIDVEYENIPSEIQYLFGYDLENLKIGKGFRSFLLSRVIDYSENKEDLKYKIDANKFNI